MPGTPQENGKLAPRQGMAGVRRPASAYTREAPADVVDLGELRLAVAAESGGGLTVVVEAAAQAEPPPEASVDEPARRTVAVLVCHGMGQQVPFETLDSVAQLMEPDHAGSAPGTPPRPQVEFGRLGDRRMPRAEVTLEGGGMLHDVHVYEGYWAPLMEGQVRAWDVTRFLFGAGFAGLRYGRKARFDRYMFGAVRPLPVRWATLPVLVVSFAVVCSALVLYATFGFVVAARAWDLFFLPSYRTWPGQELVKQLSYDLLRSPLSGGIVLGGLAWVHQRIWNSGPPGKRPPRLHNWREGGGERPWPGARWVLLLAVVAAWSLATMAWIVVDTTRWYLTDGTEPAPVPEWVDPVLHTPLFLLFLVLAGVALVRLRSFYIQYLGDVAAYVSSHTVNRFNDVRDRVKAIGRDAARALYAQRTESGKPLYDKVLVVGHSLGSVVAYETLNSVLNEDAELKLGLDVEGRTLGLVTFGSPLDKTAFIFRTQLHYAEVREALAAANQPLIQPGSDQHGTPRGRIIEWVNLWSPLDPISGPLEFYDPPKETPPDQRPSRHTPVLNLVDPGCSVYGAAHNQYWKNPLLASVLFGLITAPPAPRPAAGSPAREEAGATTL